jgi:hypothetical protein
LDKDKIVERFDQRLAGWTGTRYWTQASPGRRQLRPRAVDERDMLVKLREDVHAAAVLDLTAAAFLWRRRPRLARRLLEQAWDGLRVCPRTAVC